MGTEYRPDQVLGIEAAAALEPARFIGFDGNYPAADAKAFGVSIHAADSGRLVNLVASGTALVEAGAAIAVGAPVKTDATGKALTATTEVFNGYALEAAAADGDIIEVHVK